MSPTACHTAASRPLCSMHTLPVAAEAAMVYPGRLALAVSERAYGPWGR